MSGFSDRRLDRNGLPGEFGGRGGNRTLICWLQASGPPIERLPRIWLRAGELNATRVAYEASMTPVHLPAILVREAGVEPAASRLSVECSTTLSFPGYTRKEWSPVPDSNWLFRITGPAHRRLCLQGPQILEPMERIERSSVAYHATALPLSYIGWSQRG